MKIIDQSTDTGYAHLHALIQQFPSVRAMAKTAELDESYFSTLPDSAFAWPEKRAFPIHNKEHTALSIAYRKLQTDVPSTVDSRLKIAADIYNIPEFESATKTAAAPEEDWLLPEQRRFRVDSAETVKIAERVLWDRYTELSVDDRATAFTRLASFSKKYSAPLEPKSMKLAGFTLTSTKKLRDYIDARRVATKDDRCKTAYAKLYEGLYRAPKVIRDRVTQTKIASTLLDLDTQGGLVKYYGKQLADPLMSVFNTTKLAEDEVHVGQDQYMDKSRLGQIPLTFWQDTLGPEVTAEIAPDGQNVDVETLGQVLATLPADLQATIQRQLAAYR